ncbi:hypothetical protein GGR58DRAFT_523253 [Xylaria digitata]|nr:hypothetical protein GGR58DRAFT_523253 [Xylaria digitata]
MPVIEGDHKGEEAIYDDNLIRQYFDLEQASLSSTQISGSVSIHDSAISRFIPITDRKEDPFEIWLAEAVTEENDSGGGGPFVFPHSPSVFMGYVDEAEERLVKEIEAVPSTPLIRTGEWQISWANNPQSRITQIIPPGSFTHTLGQQNLAYNPHVPVVHTLGYNWNYDSQIASVESMAPGQLTTAYNPQINLPYRHQFQEVRPIPPQPVIYNQNLIYNPQPQVYGHATYY